MMTAIRKHLRDFIAVAALIVIAAGVSYYIFQEQRLRIPILEEKPFELKAEFETAQAVSCRGQGQTIRVAGVRVGDVSEVELEDGVGVVTFDDRPRVPADLQGRDDPDAPADRASRTCSSSSTPAPRRRASTRRAHVVPVANTAPDVNLDEILEALDSDTQAYLRRCSSAPARASTGATRTSASCSAALGPINRDLDKLNSEVAKRDENLKRLIHNFNVLTRAVGQQDQDLVELVAAVEHRARAIAEQDPRRPPATALLPGARQARQALAVAKDFGDVLGPAFNDLRPFARNLDEVNRLDDEPRGEHHAGAPGRDPAVRPRGARSRCPTCGRGQRLSRAAPRPLTTVGKQAERAR